MGQSSSAQNKYNEYEPSPSEDVTTGVFGIMIFLALSLVAACGVFYWKIENSTNKAFFATIFLVGICEQPRYWNMAISGGYTSTGAYGVHLMASIFFFLSFSLVAYQWAGILSMASIFESVVSRQGLFLLNAFFGLFDIISAGLCWTSDNLLDYFASRFFLFVTFMDTLKNFLFSSALMYYGLKILYRFQNYTAAGRSTTATRPSTRSRLTGDDIPKAVGGNSSTGRNLLGNVHIRSDSVDKAGNSDRSIDFFRKALHRITIVLTVSTMCFMLRVIMLICKMVALHEETTVTNPTFALFGFGWFLFSDFIPRAVPATAFITAMVMSHRHTEADKAYLAKQANRVAAGNFDDMLDPEEGQGGGGRLSDEDIAMDSLGPGDHVKDSGGLSHHGQNENL